MPAPTTTGTPTGCECEQKIAQNDGTKLERFAEKIARASCGGTGQNPTRNTVDPGSFHTYKLPCTSLRTGAEVITGSICQASSMDAVEPAAYKKVMQVRHIV